MFKKAKVMWIFLTLYFIVVVTLAIVMYATAPQEEVVSVEPVVEQTPTPTEQVITVSAEDQARYDEVRRKVEASSELFELKQEALRILEDRQ